MPRLERNTPGSGDSASRGPGRPSVITAYQKKSCTSSGTLRMNSTYAALRVLSRKFFDSRQSPIAVPSTVASTMPTSATASVLVSPTTSARR